MGISAIALYHLNQRRHGIGGILTKPAQHLGGASGSGISATQVFNVQAMPLPRSSSPDAGSPSFAYPGGSFPGGSPAPAGGPQAWLTIRLPQGGQEIYRIEKPEINIGRQRSNDIIVEDKRVSRNHATIRYQNGQFTLFDRNSVNGIVYNGKRLDRQQTLRSGDYFTIGSYDFYFDERR